jgi:hypothetical protein
VDERARVASFWEGGLGAGVLGGGGSDEQADDDRDDGEEGRKPCVTARALVRRADEEHEGAASIEPVPVRASVRPTAGTPAAVTTMPRIAAIARKRL